MGGGRGAEWLGGGGGAEWLGGGGWGAEQARFVADYIWVVLRNPSYDLLITRRMVKTKGKDAESSVPRNITLLPYLKQGNAVH